MMFIARTPALHLGLRKVPVPRVSSFETCIPRMKHKSVERQRNTRDQQQPRIAVRPCSAMLDS